MGEFEQLVLLAIARRENNAYGMEIRDEIEQRTGRDISYGAVYRALDRLERKGFVSFSLSEPMPERGGRARKYFRVEPAGSAALRSTRRAMTLMWDGVTL